MTPRCRHLLWAFVLYSIHAGRCQRDARPKSGRYALSANTSSQTMLPNCLSSQHESLTLGVCEALRRNMAEGIAPASNDMHMMCQTARRLISLPEHLAPWTWSAQINPNCIYCLSPRSTRAEYHQNVLCFTSYSRSWIGLSYKTHVFYQFFQTFHKFFI